MLEALGLVLNTSYARVVLMPLTHETKEIEDKTEQTETRGERNTLVCLVMSLEIF